MALFCSVVVLMVKPSLCYRFRLHLDGCANEARL
jgi:hypothetical protein